MTPSIVELLDDMIETMQKYDGAGLAAPQVGVLRRIAVVDVDDGNGITELINPEIIEHSGSNVDREGCLSVPNKAGTVERPDYVKLRTLTRDGREEVIEAREMLARALCHELDHLDGVLITDKIIEYVDVDDHRAGRRKRKKR
jgi:peptide deformylase